MNPFVEWGALGNILLFGILVGAGLPALYALGVLALDGAAKNPARAMVLRGAAYLCFGAVVAAIIVALLFIANRGH